MNENIEFLQAFLKNPAKVGSIRPSSPELARKMIEDLKLDGENSVLELGVGTGAITRYLRDVVPNDNSYLGIELDKDLVRLLKRNLPEMRILRGDAANSFAIHERSGVGKVEYIICCLPFASLPKGIGESIMNEIDKFMRLGCTFRTFQYAHGFYFPSAIKLRDFMDSRWGKARRSPLIIKNVPPAYTLTWSSKVEI